jgi:hypothetical protein
LSIPKNNVVAGGWTFRAEGFSCQLRLSPLANCYSGFFWDRSAFLSLLAFLGCGRRALTTQASTVLLMCEEVLDHLHVGPAGEGRRLSRSKTRAMELRNNLLGSQSKFYNVPMGEF